MTDDKNNDPGKRLRNILRGDKDDGLMSRLPRAGHAQSPTTSSSADVPPIAAPRSTPSQSALVKSLAGKMQSLYRNWKIGPPFWTITGLFSLIVNAVLIAILVILLRTIGNLQATAGGVSAGLISGLYTNFEKMDRASIIANIPVDADVPLNITIPVRETTRITLAEPVIIPNAHVRIITGTVNIDADAVVTLPVNTTLPVNLSFDLPLQDTIHVHLDVPVNIPLASTQLHEPFVGLQDTVKPVYCLVEPNALNLDGNLVCR